ncbi:hypothetical protein CAEBREN_25321 [Caenorhabditis brenneri]|uniref:Uncharacterized protein n=1 Tax=Caenorhabditis brenneri TaxID=135651 RepID=G0MJ29_CAEBE|nr:hypothetical protein CAEBREN_25321 [Caenorhabditis brenneri]
MKFKSISIFLFLIDLVHGREGPLSVEENQRRLKTCGIDARRLYPHPWLFSINSNATKDHMIGTFISSRHFLTSSGIIFHHSLVSPSTLVEWLLNECSKPSEHIQYERESYPYEFHLSNPNKPGYVPILRNLRRIYFPRHCNQKVLKNARTEEAPLILEFVEEEQMLALPCLGAGDSSQKADVWVVGWNGLSKRSTLFTSPTPLVYSAEIDNGAILEKNIGEIVTVIGIRTSGMEISGSLSNTMKTNFYRMDWLEKSFCDLIGVCKEGAVRPEPQSSTEGATTSGSLETSGTSETSDPHEAATLEPSTVTAGTLDTSVNPITSENPGTGTSPKVVTTVLPPAVPHRRTMPPEYEDHGDYDQIFDSLYEFPEFREIEERPNEKKGCRKGFELVLGILLVFLV